LIASDFPSGLDYDADFGSQSRTQLSGYISKSRSRQLRHIDQWAEDEVVIPTGPYAGLRFSMGRQPVAKLLYAAFKDPHWQEYAITGSTQTGKSFLGFALPVCWTLCELEEDAIIAAPTKEILEDKVKRDIYPILENSRYRDIIPTAGGGSKGGIPDRIDMRNGTVLKLMSFQGGDKSKASFTCPNIFITETDGAFSQTTSQEASPIEQIIARSRATEREKRFILYECTVSSEDGNIWTLVHERGSAAQINLKCPKCRKWSRPDREHLRGWEKAKSEIEAEEKTKWYCPKCNKSWSEKQRREANQKALLVHRGQTVKRNKVIGEYPPTRTLGFRFAAVNNLFLPAKDVGVDCWNVMQDEDDLDGEKKLTQFVFCLPYKPPALDVVKMDRASVEQRTLSTSKGVPPKETKWITLGFDVGKYDCWWVAIAWLLPSRVGLIFDYGRLRLRMQINGTWCNANDIGFDTVFAEIVSEWKGLADKGWVRPDGEILDYDALWIDCRYQGDEHDNQVVYDSIKRWSDSRVLPVMGHAQNTTFRQGYRVPRSGSKYVITVGNHYYIKFVPEILLHQGHVDSDAWKTITQRRFLKQAKSAGSLMLYDSKNPREHATFVKHIDSEVREDYFEPGKGHVSGWVVKREANHYLDSTVYAGAAGHYVGFRVSESNEPKKRKPKRRNPMARNIPIFARQN